MEATITTERVLCNWCGRAIRKGTRVRWFRCKDGLRLPHHGSCLHRFTAVDCRCDICTGDIH